MSGAGQIAGRHAMRGCGVEDASPVQMQPKAVPLGKRAHAAGVLDAQGGSPTSIVGVLQANETGGREVRVVASNRLLDGPKAKSAVALIRDRMGGDPSPRGPPPPPRKGKSVPCPRG